MKAPMITTSVTALKSAIQEHWKNVPAGDTAIRIISSIEAHADPDAEWSLADILGLLGPSVALAEAISAMAILTQSEYAVFQSCAVFVDEDNQRHRLSSEDFHRVQVDDVVAHPVTGVLVERASEQVFPRFELIPGLCAAVLPNS
jgi:hypothetical protein